MSTDFDTPNLIDLGDTFAPRPEPERSARLALRWAKAVRLAVPTLLSLFLISSAASAAPPPLVPVAHIAVAPGATIAVFGTRAVVLDGQSGDDRIDVVGLAGEPNWTAPLRVSGPNYAANLIGDAIIVTVGELDPSVVRAEAFDVRTGRHLWDRPAGLADVDASGAVILETALPDGGSVLYRVDPRTGATLWSRPVPPTCNTYFPDAASAGGSQSMVELCAHITEFDLAYVESASLVLVDLGSGVTRATRAVRMPNTPGKPSPGHGFVVFPVPTVTFANGLILVETDVPAATIAAYRLGDATLLWSGVPIINSQAVGGCGLVLCVQTPTGVEAIDPGTGTVVPSGVPPDAPDPTAYQFALVAVGNTPGGATTVVESAGEGMLLEPPVHTYGQVWLGVLRPSRIRDEWMTTLIQPLPGIGQGGCKQMGAYLACAPARGEVTFWRLPPPSRLPSR